jgi:hypothetical protein
LLIPPAVPSQQHEILVEMFRHRPQLACELLEVVLGIGIPTGTIELASNDLSQAIAVEYRADAVAVSRDPDGRPTCAVIVEVQLHVDRGKHRTWPLYVTALRARLDCAVLLLVITTDYAVARWARGTIEIGHPGFALQPIVIGPGEVPRVTDRELVRRAPELGVLSVMAHRDLEVAVIVASEIVHQPESTRRVYLDLVFAALPEAAEAALKELLMEKYQYQSRVVREYVAQGREEGREQGLRSAILEFVRAKLGELPPEYERVLAGIHDEPALTALVADLGRARDRGEVEAVFARLPGCGTERE